VPHTSPPRRLDPLVGPAALHEVVGSDWLVVADATEVLHRSVEGGPYQVRSGRPGFEQAHIPGACFADVAGALSDPAAAWPFVLPPPEQLGAAFGALGIGADTHVVAYSQAAPMWATRLWWLLRYCGFDAVSVLDGGLPAWRAAGLPVESGVGRTPTPEDFPLAARPHLVVDRARVQDIVAGASSSTLLVNTLPVAAFRGEGPGSYSRPGRIPGSLSLPSAHLLDPQTSRLRPPAELSARLGPLLTQDTPVVAYCGSGISATVPLFALALSGRDDAALYDGSLTEWSADPTLPLVRGDDGL